MSLSEGDKDTCREIAREIITEVIKYHIESCPHGKTLMASKWFLVGICIGSGLAGGGVALALAKVVLTGL